MRARSRFAALAVALAGSTGAARAQHRHEAPQAGAGVAVAVAMVAASFDTLYYSGDYEGIVPTLSWADERVAARASVGTYRVAENGASSVGVGDVVVAGSATVLRESSTTAGLLTAISVPTGNPEVGFGMGHVMVMPAAFGTWTIDPVVLAATAGYTRAIGASTEHDHGMWPLVDPMNPSELTWSARADVAMSRPVHAGVGFSGGIPLGGGDNRVIGAVRGSWQRSRFVMTAELQAGIDGRPFTIRGVVATALSF